MPPFRNLRKTSGEDLVRGHALEICALKFDAASAGMQQTGDGVQNGGLTGAVCADERDDLALVYLEGHTLDGIVLVDGVDAAVIDVQIVYFKHCSHVHASFFRPR